MKYEIKNSLLCRGATEQEADMQIDGLFLIGDDSIASYTDGECRYGENYCDIFPAVLGGEKCFLLREQWSPCNGYSASGTDETILTFEEGITLLLDRGAYEHLWPVAEGR